MKVTEIQTTNQGILYALETPQIFKSDCISFDDSEVNSNNASDTVESCKETTYSHLVQTTNNGYDLYYPADANGLLLYDYPILSYPTGKLAEAMIKLYGNTVKVYHHLKETPHQACDFDDWHPDHKI